MARTKVLDSPQFGEVKTANELGKIIRAVRKNQNLTLEKVSGLTGLGMRFLSELERGKETAELGKTLKILNRLGLEVIIQPRGQKHFQGMKYYIDIE